ncbi:flagellar basal body-associated FliL family protein [Sulfurospirillum arcachonense]|uniref:flagellar basal body-associated FliL family protein n=1 Tax=Sulfurospirillum arcachonense TaxID=57666 RepID=UPI00046A1090|nr:flagellar basal body-associated FliL family protein [Sulfurospirillum arcachonense]
MNKILKISALVIILVALTYLIVGTFFMKSSKTNTSFGGFGKMVAPGSTMSTKSTDKLEVSMDKILINMSKGPYKYMKADMAFKMKDESSRDELIEKMPYIRDTVLRFSSNQDSAQLATDKGKQQYKADLQNVIYDSFGIEIENVYFSDFVLAK